VTDDSVIRWVLVVEGMAALGVILLLLLSGVRGARARAARARTRAAVHRMVAARVGGGSFDAGDETVVRGARPRHVVRAITDFAPSMGGADRGILADVADLLARTDRRLTDRRWWRRLDAGRLLTLLGISEAQVRLLLRDANPYVRAQGATAAAAWPFPDAPALLADMLHDPSEVCRFAAKQAVVRFGPPAMDALLDALRREPVGLSQLADTRLDVLTTMPTPAMLDVGVRYSRAERASTRRSAARLLAAVGAPEAADRLIAMLADVDADVRKTVARALGTLGDWRAASALGARLEDPAYEVRIAAAGALQRLGAPGTLMLRRALTSGGTHGAAVARQTLDVIEHLSTAAPS
jgi:hypothetical protein